MIDSLRRDVSEDRSEKNIGVAVNSTAIWKYRKRDNVTVHISVTLT